MGQLSFLYRQLFVHPPHLPPTLTLSGLIILITGSNSGIGLETARLCVQLNCTRLILAVRSLSKGEAAKTDILNSSPKSQTAIEVWELDMESFASLSKFGERVNALERLDVAILNAGIFKFSWEVGKEGFETGLMVNHIATAMLSLLLLPILKRTTKSTGKASRLTFLNSEVHMWTPFNQEDGEKEGILDNVNDENMWGSAIDHYSVTKLLGVFWVQELAVKVGMDEGVINMVNPGSVVSGLHRGDGGIMMRLFDRVFGRSGKEAARLVVDAAAMKGAESHGKYLSEAKLILTSAFVRSEEGQQLQKRVWRETMEILKKHEPEGGFEQM